MTPVRAAVIGCGDISIVHLEAIAKRDGTVLVGVADVDPGRRSATAAQWDVPGFASVDELIAAVRPDVVHVCTPHDQHEPVAVAALAAGVHVLTEKPLADSPAAGEAIAAAAAASGAKLAVCFQNRYNAPVQATQRLLASGELGAVRGAAATVLWHRLPDYYLDRPWRGTWAGGGGGLLMNQAIHTLDLLQWLLGPVADVAGHAATRALADVIEVEDTAELRLRHESGATSVLYATLGHAANSPVTIEIVTEHATLTLRGDLTVEHADGRVETVRERESAGGGRAYWGVSHELLIDDFHASLADPDPFWIGADAGLATLSTITAVYDSSFPERARATVRKDAA
ncbi:Gfo/Idh/MocA family protein [Agrococcus beijingensis]|uniref:Gfo/Idh/MocA family protein n=1 Tax=Agrococcus beijingensis TaxID=3068634 RepID=UPI002740BE3B|nr:Gfo/Idh/MocA family oxidoreductase [Agrococcus sp. REN33]